MRVAIIPARGGSKRIPRKNIRPFHGKPIIAYSIEAAKASGLFDGGIWVSTEDVEIADTAHRLGASVIDRPARLAELDGEPDPGTQEITAHGLEHIERYAGKGRIEHACCIYPCTPMISAERLRFAYDTLRCWGYWYVIPVGRWLVDPGMFYMGKVSAFLNRASLLDIHTGLIPIDPRTAIDINTEEDWAKAEALFTATRRGDEGKGA